MPTFGRYLDAELVERLDRIRPSARRNVDGLGPGPHRSPIKGASLNFRQHRPYTHGDDPRRIDWRVLARTDRLFIKEFDHDVNLQCVVAIDTTGSMAYGSAAAPAKSRYAATLATALAYLLLRGGESVGMATLANGAAALLPPAQGPAQLARIVDRLERATIAGPGNVSASLDRLSRRFERRSLLMVLSDFFTPPGPLGRSLARLTRAGHTVACLQLLHPDEVTFPFRAFTSLQNLEGSDARLAEPAVARAAYLHNFRSHTQSLQRACSAGRSTLHVAQTDRPPIGVIERVLHSPAAHPR